VDPKALAVALAIEADPARDVTLEKLAAESGTTLRTLQRRFASETGLPLSEWRQVARMMEAAARLLDGESVTSAGLYAGYSGASAFINAFKARCGETPGAFRSGGDASLIKPARVAD
jgi:AraC-like DNA-binding protein